jgi:hypothetical protein
MAWVATCPTTKFVPAWLVGHRDAECALVLMLDLKDRLANRVQLTTDGLQAYLGAVEKAFGGDVDYAMLVKIYAARPRDIHGTARPRASVPASIALRATRLRSM